MSGQFFQDYTILISIVWIALVSLSLLSPFTGQIGLFVEFLCVFDNIAIV